MAKAKAKKGNEKVTETVGSNVRIASDGETLVITIDLVEVGIDAKGALPTGTGKNVRVASTGGNKKIVLPEIGEITLGLNAYRAPQTTAEVERCIIAKKAADAAAALR